MKKNISIVTACVTICCAAVMISSCDIYDPGDIVPTYRDLVVTYETNGGTPVGHVIVAEEGEYAPVPLPPEKEGYVFDGWYSDAGLTSVFNPVTDRVYRDMTLYAKYITEAENAARFEFEASSNTLKNLKEEYKNSIGYLTLPDNVDGTPVYNVNAWAFYQDATILTVTVPEGYKTIGDSAFEGCSGIRKVKLPATMESAGIKTFGGCSETETFDLGGLKAFSTQTFSLCTNVDTLIVPGTCQTFPTQGFYQSLANVIVLEEGVTVLADLAFHEASAGIVVLPKSLTTVGTNAFAYFNYHYPGAFILRFLSDDPSTLTLSPNGCFEGSTPIIEVPATAVEAYKAAWSATVPFEIRAISE